MFNYEQINQFIQCVIFHNYFLIRRGTHGGWRRAYCRNACFFLLCLIRMSPFAHPLSLHRFLKCYFRPKVPKPVEKIGKTKQKVSPRVPCPASQTLSMGQVLLVFCLFYRCFLPLCQSNNVCCSSLCVVFFLMLGLRKLSS